MNNRQEKILTLVIKEYTKTAFPVGSKVLAEKYDFKESTATLRNDMASLEREGFLYQPHTSAGRVPSDKGYRYFVEEIMPERELSKKEQQAMQKELLQLRANNVRLTRSTAKLLSTLSGYVAVSGFPGKGEFSEFGLRALLREAKAENLDELCHLAEALDYIDEKCDDLMKELKDGETKIFIGKENPIGKSKDYSMVVSQYEQDGEKGILALIGPKRMNYDKNKSIIEYVKKMLGGAGVLVVIVFI